MVWFTSLQYHLAAVWKIDFREARLGGPNNGQLQLSRKEMTVAHTIVTKTMKMVSGYILEVELKGTAGTEWMRESKYKL